MSEHTKTAFPQRPDACQQEGLSLRDWFAGQALMGIIANEGAYGSDKCGFHRDAETAYEYADAMLAQRAKRE